MLSVNGMCMYCIYNSMNVCKWCMSGTENSILLSVLPHVPILNKLFNQSDTFLVVCYSESRKT